MTVLGHTQTAKSPIVEFLEAIKFSHTVFALPFALIAVLLGSEGQWPAWNKVFWIVCAMVGARTWAMCVNRIVDAHIDALNPRTASRAIPAGRLSRGQMWLFASLGAALFIVSAGLLSPVALACAVPVLLILASYSYMKRLTSLCHFWLGLCLGLAPLGAWVALRNSLSQPMLILTFAICFWVAGFDIIYALQDEDFDRTNRLHSLPSRLGTDSSLWIARGCHVLAGLLFVWFGLEFKLSAVFFVGVAVSVLMMAYEHWLVRRGNLKNINMAFFNLNGWIAVLLLLFTAASLIQF